MFYVMYYLPCMDKRNRKPKTYVFDSDVIINAKIEAIKQGKTLTQFIEEAISEKLQVAEGKR